MELVIEEPTDHFANALTLSYAVSVKSTTPLQSSHVSHWKTALRKVSVDVPEKIRTVCGRQQGNLQTKVVKICPPICTPGVSK